MNTEIGPSPQQRENICAKALGFTLSLSPDFVAIYARDSKFGQSTQHCFHSEDDHRKLSSKYVINIRFSAQTPYP